MNGAIPMAGDPMLLQAIRQANAAWAAVRDSHINVYLASAGVIVNFLLALVAIGIPAWQRRMTKRDDSEAGRRSKQRFVTAFKMILEAQDAIFAASKMQNPKAVEEFGRAERVLRGASLALLQSSAAAVPVSAIMSAAVAQHNASKTLAHYPDLVNYGSNLLFYNGLGDELQGYADETRTLLEAVEASDWEV